MSDTVRTRLAKASVFMGDDDVAWVVAETPGEIMHTIDHALNEGRRYITLTLANDSHEWNGRPLHLRADRVTAVSPPKIQVDDDDDDDEDDD